MSCAKLVKAEHLLETLAWQDLGDMSAFLSPVVTSSAISRVNPFRCELASLSPSFLAEAGSHNQGFQILALAILGEVALEFDGVSREK